MQQLEHEVEDSDLLAICHSSYNLVPPIKVNTEVDESVISKGSDNDASASLLNWDTFQKINVSSRFVSLPKKCKLQMYIGGLFGPKECQGLSFPMKKSNF